jgi:hypothetical protein
MDLGYVEGRNIVLEHRFPKELPAHFRSMAAELAASGVDVLVSIGANADCKSSWLQTTAACLLPSYF